jgi:hypothetical protein
VKAPSRLSVDLWWVDIPGQERAFFTSAKEVWHHAGEAAHAQLAAAQVFRGTFALRSASVEHTGDFSSMVESFRKARACTDTTQAQPGAIRPFGLTSHPRHRPRLARPVLGRRRHGADEGLRRLEKLEWSDPGNRMVRQVLAGALDELAGHAFAAADPRALPAPVVGDCCRGHRCGDGLLPAAIRKGAAGGPNCGGPSLEKARSLLTQEHASSP